MNGPNSSSAGSSPHKGVVLVAEDDPVVRNFLKLSLGQDGLEVLESSDGTEALAIASGHHFDLLITDLWMPRMNGVELIEAIKAQGHSTPVVVLSGHLTVSSTDKLRALGVSRVLPKPISIDTLREAVREAMLGGVRPEHTPEDKATVLIVDDDPAVRELLREGLSRAGYNVEEAADGEEALEKALAHDLSLILMDLNMPRMNGVEAVSALKRASRDCFIICMTGESDRHEMAEAVNRGALRCIRKPFNMAELIAEIHRLDIISRHRRLMVERERQKLAAASAAEKGWLAQNKQRYGRKFKWLVALAIASVLFLSMAVPIVYTLLERAHATATTMLEKVGEAADAASRIEGYLRRDEERELNPLHKP